MMPPIFPIVAASAAAQAALGAAPVRFFPFGAAPQDVALPYAVWQVVDGAPENYLGNLPDADVCTVLVDVYAAEPDSAASATVALRDAALNGDGELARAAEKLFAQPGKDTPAE